MKVTLGIEFHMQVYCLVILSGNMHVKNRLDLQSCCLTLFSNTVFSDRETFSHVLLQVK